MKRLANVPGAQPYTVAITSGCSTETTRDIYMVLIAAAWSVYRSGEVKADVNSQDSFKVVLAELSFAC